MDLNYILSIAFVYIVLLGNIDTKPLINLENDTHESLEISIPTQNNDKPNESIADVQNGVTNKMVVDQFRNEKKDNTESKPTVKPESHKVFIKALAANQDYTTESEVTGETEWTVSISRFKLDDMGKWVYNPWGITYGKVWKDKRFNVNSLVTIPRITKDKDPQENYYPDDNNLDNVCADRSTIYNIPKIKNWLSMYPYSTVHSSRPIMNELRRSLFKKGNPEQCHTVDYSQFRDFQECMLRRHQRLEYYIPKYPLHQLVIN
ncbi:uncharacterized protein LOC6573503 isoform X1 [Drosophila mojavensis]|uniref:uncharacterized protein LOC6573503 isoform X1 n=1 Tax=Drosophila mojavensis TaxID=7230 RepID=UPI0013EECA72|nr:uncharacterized protein LOC6573503 isoform X1 [Drosophila mojavensis]